MRLFACREVEEGVLLSVDASEGSVVRIDASSRIVLMMVVVAEQEPKAKAGSISAVAQPITNQTSELRSKVIGRRRGTWKRPETTLNLPAP